jgi:hypothetical protein
MAASKCPVCDWPIKDPVKVKTPKGVITVCCDECAEKLRAESGVGAKAGK